MSKSLKKTKPRKKDQPKKGTPQDPGKYPARMTSGPSVSIEGTKITREL